MRALNHISSAFHRRDDEPNKRLAQQVAQTYAVGWVKELVANLHNPDKNIQSDCIKVLYELGELGSADLIAPYVNNFVGLLSSENNRMVWGAMAALDTIAPVSPADVFSSLAQIVAAIDTGSVITKNHGVSILATLSAMDEYAEVALPLLFEQLRVCVAKQLPQHAEKAAKAVAGEYKELLITIIHERFEEVETDARKKRLTKLIRRMSK